MSIKLRLVLSYIAMLIIPLILTVIAAVVLLATQLGSLQHANNLGADFLGEYTNRAAEIYVDLKKTIRDNPDRLSEPQYLKELDKKLEVLNMGIAVKREDQLLYISRFANIPDMISRLDEGGMRTRGDKDEPVRINGEPYGVLGEDFRFSSGTPGTLYYITGLGPIGRFAGKYFSSLGIAILLILILTNGIITYIVSRSILRPLRILKRGTDEIRQGNLNFKVACSSNDEIGEVCAAFEQMRSKLKESIDQQLQLEENRKELISSISHDLKTPITSIKGYVEGIVDGVADTPEKMEKYIRTIYTKAVDMDRLIDDLFLFSKLDLKKLPFNFEKVDLVRYFEDCREELQLDLEKHNIRLELEKGVTQAIAAADREKLKRVIVNIVENSVKYMNREDGRILIRISDIQDSFRIGIEDNGPGIAPEELPLIFDRFYRTDRSRNSSTGGSGLGLAIARQIIEGHGGRIWAESEPGQGTRIMFTLKKAWENKAGTGEEE